MSINSHNNSPSNRLNIIIKKSEKQITSVNLLPNDTRHASGSFNMPEDPKNENCSNSLENVSGKHSSFRQQNRSSSGADDQNTK